MSVVVILPDDYIEFQRAEFTRFGPLLTKRSGVYVFYGMEGESLYVGKSKDIKRRLSEHFRGGGNSIDFYLKIQKVRIYLEDNPFYVDVYESFLIQELKPEFNREGLYFEENYAIISNRLSEISVQLREIREEMRDLKISDSSVGNIIDADAELLDDEFSLGEALFTARRIAELERRRDRLIKERAILRRRDERSHLII